MINRNNRLRLAVYRSNKAIYAQIIDDEKGRTLVSFSSTKLTDAKKKEAKKATQQASLVGEEIAKLAKAKKITKVMFDRRDYRYHGRVKALADGARSGGLDF